MNPLFAEDLTDLLAKNWLAIVVVILLIIGLIFLLIFFSFVRLWIQCFLAGARIGIVDMVRMKLLNVDYGMIVRQKIALVQAGVKVSTQEMEAHYLSRGNVPKTAAAVIAAHKAGMVDFDGRRIDTITEGMMVDPGQLVRCIDVRAGKVVVRPVEKPDLGDLETAIFN